jgi:hypothetical protein
LHWSIINIHSCLIMLCQVQKIMHCVMKSGRQMTFQIPVSCISSYFYFIF